MTNSYSVLFYNVNKNQTQTIDIEAQSADAAIRLAHEHVYPKAQVHFYSVTNMHGNDPDPSRRDYAHGQTGALGLIGFAAERKSA